MTIDKKRSFIINFLYVVIIAAIAFVVFKYLIGYLAPFLIGALVAVLLHKPAEFLSRKTRIPRGICSVVLVVLTLAGVSYLLVLLCTRLYSELAALVKVLPEYVPLITTAFDNLSHNFGQLMNSLPGDIGTTISNLPGTIAGEAVGYLAKFVTELATAVGTSIPGLLLSTIITVVASCYTTADYDKITRTIRGALPRDKWATILDIKDLLLENVVKMLRGYALLMFITFCELAIALTVLGYDYSVMIALIIAIIDILPVLGTGAVLIPWAIISLLLGDYVAAIGLIVTYLIIIIIRNALEPRIIGKQIGLHPLIMLIAIYVGLKLFGLVGLIGLPLTIIVLMALYRKRHPKEEPQQE